MSAEEKLKKEYKLVIIKAYFVGIILLHICTLFNIKKKLASKKQCYGTLPLLSNFPAAW